MFQDNVKKCRKAKHLSQEDFAMKLCVVRQTVSKWEKGSSLPDVEMLLKIAEVLEVTVNDLLESNGATIKENEAMNYDVIIIGAGPGGIFAAYELLQRKPELRVAVFEAGHELSKRHCPIDGKKKLQKLLHYERLRRRRCLL